MRLSAVAIAVHAACQRRGNPAAQSLVPGTTAGAELQHPVSSWHPTLLRLIQVQTHFMTSTHIHNNRMHVLLQPTRARVRRLAALMYLRCPTTRRSAASWLSQTTAALVSSPPIEQESRSWPGVCCLRARLAYPACAGCRAQHRRTAVTLCAETLCLLSASFLSWCHGLVPFVQALVVTNSTSSCSSLPWSNRSSQPCSSRLSSRSRLRSRREGQTLQHICGRSEARAPGSAADGRPSG